MWFWKRKDKQKAVEDAVKIQASPEPPPEPAELDYPKVVSVPHVGPSSSPSSHQRSFVPVEGNPAKRDPLFEQARHFRSAGCFEVKIADRPDAFVPAPQQPKFVVDQFTAPMDCKQTYEQYCREFAEHLSSKFGIPKEMAGELSAKIIAARPVEKAPEIVPPVPEPLQPSSAPPVVASNEAPTQVSVPPIAPPSTPISLSELEQKQAALIKALAETMNQMDQLKSKP